jgi:hypothetical protein
MRCLAEGKKRVSMAGRMKIYRPETGLHAGRGIRHRITRVLCSMKRRRFG